MTEPVVRPRFTVDVTYPNCPGCGIPSRGINHAGTGWDVWPCGCRITEDQAAPIRAWRGDAS